MPRIFDMLESFGDDERHIGIFHVLDTSELVIELLDGLHHELEVPIQFGLRYQEGKRVFHTNEVMTFVNERVPPPNRMGIVGSLKKVGILKYDSLSIFLLHEGKWCTDRLHLVEKFNSV